ncbi:hypothetical protein TNIN_153191 [Trichonephila inaurata madagascariensis]|uniref:Uncharacterized protein n=1 Tax=Trichonephila inaurata madagascariensis TaxID=2747483 RepID=A0A8X6YS99_9ARAC|nr:hypothetical protein TNIN_153191 [Trichonephila inaurata madagascariensis]
MTSSVRIRCEVSINRKSLTNKAPGEVEGGEERRLRIREKGSEGCGRRGWTKSLSMWKRQFCLRKKTRGGGGDNGPRALPSSLHPPNLTTNGVPELIILLGKETF